MRCNRSCSLGECGISLGEVLQNMKKYIWSQQPPNIMKCYLSRWASAEARWASAEARWASGQFSPHNFEFQFFFKKRLVVGW